MTEENQLLWENKT